MRSSDTQREQKTPEGAYLQERGLSAQRPTEGLSVPVAQGGGTSPETANVGLLEKILERENMRRALKKVKENGGAPGVDGMKTEELNAYLIAHWERIKAELMAGNYEPQPVRRVEIPKPGGKGVRALGIPTALDRLLQQATAQVLTEIFDPHFSPHSYGFRPNRRGHDAVRAARRYIAEGHGWVVDIDLAQFFDRVNHDMLMARVARRVQDKRVLRLIRKYLRSGVMVQGVKQATEEGTPQGGPLSPLLSNILLDDLDKELEKRGHKFARYADDANIYVRSKRAGERVMQGIKRFLEDKLKLKVNEEKSAVDQPRMCLVKKK